MKPSTHVYGPVPSRRLGLSLGVDILPYKTCSLDCVYCQLGKTEEKILKRKEYFELDVLIFQIKHIIQSGCKIDFITFSGSGEPTLNQLAGKLIQKIKKETDIPVAVLTNSTLLMIPEVRNDILSADLVVPSLDAVTQDIFEQVNRPHHSLKINDIIESLILFRNQFSGKIWLELMLVRGVNDSFGHLKIFKEISLKINPDKIHLNTVVRPPAFNSANPLAKQEMETIRDFLGNKCEIAADLNEISQNSIKINLQDAIVEVIKRRPVSADDIANALGKQKNMVLIALDILIQSEKIKKSTYKNKIFYKTSDK